MWSHLGVGTRMALPPMLVLRGVESAARSCTPLPSRPGDACGVCRTCAVSLRNGSTTPFARSAASSASSSAIRALSGVGSGGESARELAPGLAPRPDLSGFCRAGEARGRLLPPPRGDGDTDADFPPRRGEAEAARRDGETLCNLGVRAAREPRDIELVGCAEEEAEEVLPAPAAEDVLAAEVGVPCVDQDTNAGRHSDGSVEELV